jgi:cytoskeletal protein RodZ
MSTSVADSSPEEISDSPRRETGDDWFGFSVRGLILVVVGIVGFGIYIGVLLYGENSLTALKKLEKEKSELTHELAKLKKSNQVLQKQYFELLQLTGE